MEYQTTYLHKCQSIVLCAPTSRPIPHDAADDDDGNIKTYIHT